MKNRLKVLIASSFLLTSGITNSADINDNYNLGDTLTANTMNNIKSAVNSKQDRVNGSCAANQAISSINADGSVNCESTSSSGGGGGTSGAYTVSSSEDWTESGGDHPGVILDFTDFTVAAGQTLILPSGLTIKASGTFTNNGTIVVQTGQPITPNDEYAPSQAVVLRPGFSWSSPGIPYEPDQIRGILNPGAIAAESGEAGNQFNNAGMGGGSLVIAAGVIANNDSILAPGENAENVNDGTHCAFNVACTAAADLDSQDRGGSGGGAGGFIILASDGAMTVGTIDISGGDGSNGGFTQTVSTSGGGGGGGGIVHLLAPDLASVNLGSVDFSGGGFGSSSDNAGSLCAGNSATQEANAVCGTVRNGGVGGSLGGRGGRGGSGSSGSSLQTFCYRVKVELGESLVGYATTADANNDCHAALNGNAGYVLQTTHPQPGSLF